MHRPSSGGMDDIFGTHRTRFRHPQAEDRSLVAEHDDLNRQLVAVTPTQAEQLKDSDEDAPGSP
jgi:hypothetical protein